MAGNCAVDVVEALFQDLPELSVMECGSQITSWNSAALSRSFSNGCKILKITVGGQTCGYCLYRSVEDETEILNLVIAQSRRRLGLGKALLIGLIDKLQCSSSGAIWLEVRKSNTAAQKLYDIMGFKQAGVRKNYYKVENDGAEKSGREDALVLCKDL
jgi:ribosomal-protein-alanine N-acetyltransferase